MKIINSSIHQPFSTVHDQLVFVYFPPLIILKQIPSIISFQLYQSSRKECFKKPYCKTASHLPVSSNFSVVTNPAMFVIP